LLAVIAYRHYAPISEPNAWKVRLAVDATTVTTSVAARVIPKVKVVVVLAGTVASYARYCLSAKAAPASRIAILYVAAEVPRLQIATVETTEDRPAAGEYRVVPPDTFAAGATCPKILYVVAKRHSFE
jgi:hypothetical protein